MSIKITGLYNTHLNRLSIGSCLKDGKNSKIQLKGLSGSSLSVFAASVIPTSGRSHIFILDDKESAAYFMNDLESFSDNFAPQFFGSYLKNFSDPIKIDQSGLIQRTEVLEKISQKSNKNVIVTYPEALSQSVIKTSDLEKLKFSLSVGESVSRDFLIEFLNEIGFRETDFVYEPGEFAIRGSIIDLFSFSNDRPVRVDFFGSEVESIRFFDIETQLSENKIPGFSIIPDIHSTKDTTSNIIEKSACSLISLLEKETIVWASDLKSSLARVDEVVEQLNLLTVNGKHEGLRSFINSDTLREEIAAMSVFESGQIVEFEPESILQFHTSPQPVFMKNFELVASNLISKSDEGYTNYIFSENEKQLDRLKEIFNEIEGHAQFIPVILALNKGFVDHDLKVSFYTDHQIFERYHKYKLKEGFKGKESVSINSLNNLQPGDFVVHIDHGIGKFGGLERIDINGKTQETLKLVYKDGDTLYVSIHSLHKISKYKGKDVSEPSLHKLGSGAWNKVKQRTKSRVKDIARELIALYAQRKMNRGFKFSPDTYLQSELEASFIYEDTPDQLKSTNLVKDQMESDSPMDILVCGDVGFGKTEVAIRAAFKAVADNKQVAVLVPTTILALQHFKTFSDRLANFPCSVDHISRFRTSAEQKQILKKLEAGEIDIIIGTHKIIGKDIKFKDLGLLVVDEEQKFGVSVKEKLKGLKLNVDTLTMTATPIPRTLQFSLMGARDLAIINTPPPNRHPIITTLNIFEKEIIKGAIENEVQRGGQIFFIHNRVQNILEIEEMIKKWCPGISTVVGHGQMESSKLEKVMLGFIAGKYDVLISTTIIESGLDIPNANTIIINNAHQIGLSDLHQLRGRVGRSNKKAYCYLLSPPPQSITPEARQRLKAIEEFSELGSGFNIAMQDLDIRGAGNLLGSEQSGFISDIGFETYHRILDEAINELKESEFSHLFVNDKEKKRDSVKKYVTECQIDTDLEIVLPQNYIPGNAERVKLYRILDSIKDEKELLIFESGLTDRFGPLPPQAKELLNIVRLRRTAINMGFEKATLKHDKLILYFISDENSSYYNSTQFSTLLNLLQKEKKMKLKESKGKLSLTVPEIKSVKAALETLEILSTRTENSDQ